MQTLQMVHRHARTHIWTHWHRRTHLWFLWDCTAGADTRCVGGGYFGPHTTHATAHTTHTQYTQHTQHTQLHTQHTHATHATHTQHTQLHTSTDTHTTHTQHTQLHTSTDTPMVPSGRYSRSRCSRSRQELAHCRNTQPSRQKRKAQPTADGQLLCIVFGGL